MVTVTVVLAKNRGPQIPASQYLVKVSEGVEIGSKVFSVPVSSFSCCYNIAIKNRYCIW